MPEAHDEFFFGEHVAHSPDRGLGRIESLDQLHGGFVGAAVQRTAQGADGARDRGVHVGQGPGDDAAGEGRGVELVLRIENQRRIERLPVQLGWRLAVQQVEQVARYAVVVGFGVNAHAVRVKAVPVQKHRRQTRQQPVGRVFLRRKIALRLDVAQKGHARAQHVHRRRVRRDQLKHRLQRFGQTPIGLDSGDIGIEFRPGRQFALEQQVGHFQERRLGREIADVIAAIGQAGALLADRAQGGRSRRDAGQTAGLSAICHVVLPKAGLPLC